MKKVNNKEALEKKPALNTGKMRNHSDVVVKHRKALAETGFADCAPCPGCAGKTQWEGNEHKMKCSRAGPTGALVTVAQAQCCDGTSPILLPERIKKIRPMNRPPAP